MDGKIITCHVYIIYDDMYHLLNNVYLEYTTSTELDFLKNMLKEYYTNLLDGLDCTFKLCYSE